MRLDPDMPFEELKKAVEEKFTESAAFFKDAKVALAFDGRELTGEEEEEILAVIDRTTQLRVLCVVEKELLGQQTKETQEKEAPANVGQFFKGTLRSGQLLESETSILFLGDVETGAQVIAKGSVVVLGRLKGTVYAGAGMDNEAFVAALYMQPAVIKIGEYTRKSRVKRADGPMRPKICRVSGGRICFEIIT